MSQGEALPPLARGGHTLHCTRCVAGLPSSQTEIDSSRLALAFYCLGSLDLLDTLNAKISDADRESWKEWIWEQQAHGKYGTGFKPSSYMTPEDASVNDEYSENDTPHLIMTYTGMLSLAILRDNFDKLDRPGIIKFLRSCQRSDGSFSSIPDSTESDLRLVYCAFAISTFLDDWSGVDIAKSVTFIKRCRTYEGGYGQEPCAEAQGRDCHLFVFLHEMLTVLGGTTYCALAALHLAPSLPNDPLPLTPRERHQTVRWLIQNQDDSGGFRGRTGKDADACYCFWCGASLQILGVPDVLDPIALAAFLARCQFKYGGIAKAPGEHPGQDFVDTSLEPSADPFSPDPYHTYLSLAALSIHPPHTSDTTWKLDALDPLLNARSATAAWAREKIPAQ
ncbi:hypothetical protein JAAARDRAFT_189449 [Jaapia argillacea MUCL 33604]|uniref:Prenyltransferase alpha-alpha toroid domain-containing protein n=1 Tax=Jaapia argillacea MUCL 33604 TaxID=933084 RepID=A0A067Q7B7_9AGAM|nr:hypothetical protein JAAARDRAFT_189449 [Jaapia argillacea MUCL 33604]